MTDSKGNAIVIDYKTGEPTPAHMRQVKRYMDLLRRTGRFATVTGYLWYLTTGTLLPV